MHVFRVPAFSRCIIAARINGNIPNERGRVLPVRARLRPQRHQTLRLQRGYATEMALREKVQQVLEAAKQEAARQGLVFVDGPGNESIQPDVDSFISRTQGVQRSVLLLGLREA